MAPAPSFGHVINVGRGTNRVGADLASDVSLDMNEPVVRNDVVANACIGASSLQLVARCGWLDAVPASSLRCSRTAEALNMHAWRGQFSAQTFWIGAKNLR